MLNKKAKTQGTPQYHIHCRPGDVGEYVLLPGDPDRVRRIAKYLDKSREIAFHREFLTYTGYYHDIKVSATSTGIGTPSAAIAVEELGNVGASCFIRVGSCGALQENVDIGDLVISIGAMKQEGTSRFYVPDSYPAVPDLRFTTKLLKAAESRTGELGFTLHAGITASSSAFYGETPEWIKSMHDLRLVAVEMEASAIFTVARQRNLRAAMISAVSGNIYTGEVIYDRENEQLIRGWEHEIQVVLAAIELDKEED